MKFMDTVMNDDFKEDAMAVVMSEIAAGDPNQIGLYILIALQTKYDVIQDSATVERQLLKG